jgi:hypothetical protein
MVLMMTSHFNEDLGMVMRKHRLTDGQIVTASEVAKRAGISKATASSRLSRGVYDPKMLFAPLGKNSGCKNGNYKKYKLDDGQVVTSQLVAKSCNIGIKLARSRLSLYTDPAKVFANPDPKRNVCVSTHAERIAMTRGLGDEMFCLAMKGI